MEGCWPEHMYIVFNATILWKERYIYWKKKKKKRNFGCYLCLYEGKATYYTNIVSYTHLFGVSEVANCMFLLFHFFKRQTWTKTSYFFSHSESIVCVQNESACLTRIILRPLLASYLHGFVEKSLIGQF
jgi:hypothetical protein